MGKAMSLVTVAWFCFQTLDPQSAVAQPRSSIGVAQNESPKTEESVQETTLPSEPENVSSEAIEEAEQPRRIIRVGDNFEVGITEVVDSITLAFGHAKIQGHVLGNIFVFAGNVTIKERARILGKVTVVLGEIKGVEHLLKGTDATASRSNPYKEINGWRLVPATIDLMMHPQNVWGMPKQVRLGWGMLTFVTFTLVHILVVTLFSRQMRNMAYAVSHRLIGSTLLGLIVLIIVPYLGLLLILSIVGIPLMMLLLAILLPVVIYSETSIFLLIGNAVLPRQSNAVAVTVGYWLYRMTTAIPYLNYFIFLIASTIGLGICIRTGFGQKSMLPHKGYRRQYPIRSTYTKKRWMSEVDM